MVQMVDTTEFCLHSVRDTTEIFLHSMEDTAEFFLHSVLYTLDTTEFLLHSPWTRYRGYPIVRVELIKRLCPLLIGNTMCGLSLFLSLSLFVV